MKAAEYTRAGYYYRYAQQRAAAGDFKGSRDVALLAIAHITPDDARFHGQLAEMAEELRDDTLKAEAKLVMQPRKAPSRLAAMLNAFEWRMIDSALKI